MKIGLIREGKVPPDRRVALTPVQCKQFSKTYPDVQIIVQSSNVRVFSDNAYREQGISVHASVDDCDILLGIKEVPVEQLIPNKTYLFFSHTIKKQAFNKSLLKRIINQNIHLIDYEVLVDTQGNRIIGFGYYAGLVGAYNALRAIAIKQDLQMLKPAHSLSSLNEMMQELASFKMPKLKIAFTGKGRVAKGVKELLDAIGVKQLSVDEYLSNKAFKEPVYVQLGPEDYNKHKAGKPFDLQQFFTNPSDFEGNFKCFCSSTDILVHSAYWDTNAPVLFTTEDMQEQDFRIRVIADITCDVKGSIPSTLRSSTIPEPFYDYNPITKLEEPAFSEQKNITVMAVDNLPNELPADASEMFGDALMPEVLPLLIKREANAMIEKATIAKGGKLTKNFSYLKSWLESK